MVIALRRDRLFYRAMAVALAITAFVGFASSYFLRPIFRPATHWRLMLLATISIITPAIARLWFVHQRPPIALGLTNLFVVVAVTHDWWRDRRVHPVYIWGGLCILVSGPLRIAIGHTDPWHAIARMLLRGGE